MFISENNSALTDLRACQQLPTHEFQLL